MVFESQSISSADESTEVRGEEEEAENGEES